VIDYIELGIVWNTSTLEKVGEIVEKMCQEYL